MNDTEVRVEYAPKPSDSYRVTLWCWPNIARWVSLVVVLLAIGPIRSCWSPVSSIPELRSQMLALLVLASPIFLVWLVYPYITIWYVFGKYPVIRQRRRATISAQGVHVESEDFSTDCKWTLFSRIDETLEGFAFVHTRTPTVYIPKRCLNGPVEVAMLCRVIRENFRNKLRLRAD